MELINQAPFQTNKKEGTTMQDKRELLKFGQANAKLEQLEDLLDLKVFTFSLPAGYSCPGALHCLARANRKTGQIVDGMAQEYRCFAASDEAKYTNTRAARWHNFELLKGCQSVAEMVDLILESIPKKAEVIRVHVSGDFYSEMYFRAWMRVATLRSDIRFYAYTKSINTWIANRSMIPDNFRLTASQGGRFDALISENALVSSRVLRSVEEGAVLGLAIDHNDYLAFEARDSFGLLIHGTQKAGSEASRAVRALSGVGSYSRRTRIRKTSATHGFDICRVES
jgi:hypothetical protein